MTKPVGASSNEKAYWLFHVIQNGEKKELLYLIITVDINIIYKTVKSVCFVFIISLLDFVYAPLGFNKLRAYCLRY